MMTKTKKCLGLPVTSRGPDTRVSVVVCFCEMTSENKPVEEEKNATQPLIRENLQCYPTHFSDTTERYKLSVTYTGITAKQLFLAISKRIVAFAR